MMELEHKRALFVGMGASPLAYYRCALPAMYLGQDWIGVWGTPPDMRAVTGVIRNGRGMDFRSYDVVVLQQPRGRGWRKVIRDLQERGVTVLYEIDDYVHGIQRLTEHDFKESFTKRDLREMEVCMALADGIIVSTEYLHKRYRRFNPRVYLCLNGLDLPRYAVSLPPRATIDGQPAVTLGWAGGTGHAAAMRPWLYAVQDIMAKHPHVCFATIGQSFAAELAEEFGSRVLSLPFLALENYPAAMTLFDIALAPANDSGFFAGKSALRAMEAQALGLPVVASPHYRSVVDHAVQGFIVESAGEVYHSIKTLVEDAELRREMGAAGRQRTIGEFAMVGRATQWRAALTEAWTVSHSNPR